MRWNQGQARAENTSKRVLRGNMESVNIQNMADVAETHIENRLDVQQKERFVTTVEKEITSLHAAEENVKRSQL